MSEVQAWRWGRTETPRRIAALIVCLLACASCLSQAAAHTRSASHSVWRLSDGGAAVQIRLSALDFSALQASPGASGNPFTRDVFLKVNGEPCAEVPGSFAALLAGPGSRRFEWRVDCRGMKGDLLVGSNLLFEALPAHLHFTTVYPAADAAPIELVLTRDDETAALPAGENARPDLWSRAASHTWLGVTHIATGADHLVFLWLLAVVATSLRALTWVVTGFTVGHSATLCLAALGYVRVDLPAVEALIGLSIAVLAVEGVWLGRKPSERDPRLPVATVTFIGLCAALSLSMGPGVCLALTGAAIFTASYFGLISKREDPERLRWLMAALFGLVHGFGFAGALQTLGSENTSMVFPLLTFNLGVELGQVMLLALAWPLLLALRRMVAGEGLALWSGTLGAALGAFWLVSRALG